MGHSTSRFQYVSPAKAIPYPASIVHVILSPNNAHDNRISPQSFTIPHRFIAMALVLPTNRNTATFRANAKDAFISICDVDHRHATSPSAAATAPEDVDVDVDVDDNKGSPTSRTTRLLLLRMVSTTDVVIDVDMDVDVDVEGRSTGMTSRLAPEWNITPYSNRPYGTVRKTKQGGAT